VHGELKCALEFGAQDCTGAAFATALWGIAADLDVLLFAHKRRSQDLVAPHHRAYIQQQSLLDDLGISLSKRLGST
jgi:hypothetical protein